MVTEDERPSVPDWLNRLCSPSFVLRSGAPQQAINDIESLFDVCLPKRYKDFLSTTDGADVTLYDNQGRFTARFLPVVPGMEDSLTIANLNEARGHSPLFAIGILNFEEFGFLWSEIGTQSEDCRVLQYIHDQGEACMLARSFVELLTDMSRTNSDAKYLPSFLAESGPVSWFVDEPPATPPVNRKKWWPFRKRG